MRDPGRQEAAIWSIGQVVEKSISRSAGDGDTGGDAHGARGQAQLAGGSRQLKCEVRNAEDGMRDVVGSGRRTIRRTILLDSGDLPL